MGKCRSSGFCYGVDGGSSGGIGPSLRVSKNSATIDDPLLPVKIPDSGGLGGGRFGTGLTNFLFPIVVIMLLCLSGEGMGMK